MDLAEGDAPRDRRPVLALLAANAVSTLGNATSTVALAWFVLQTTGSPARVGLVAATISIGTVLSAFLGGPLVDRFGLKRASVVTDVVSAAAVAAIPLLHLAGRLDFLVLVGIALLLSTVNTQGDTARYALMPPLANRAAITMERANAADRSIARIGQIVGPLLAGVLIALVGPVNVLFVNAATYAVSAAIVLAGVPAAARASRADPDRRGSYVDDLLEGLRFIRRDRLLFSLVLVATIANLLDVPLFSVIMPTYAQTFYGDATSLGIVLSAVAAGALVGTVVFAAVGRTWPRRSTFLACLLIAPPLFYGTLAAVPPLVLLVLVAFAAGAITGPVNPVMLTTVQARIPPHLAGRVFGALTALAGVGVPVGSVLGGVVVERLGLIPTILAMGGIYVLTIAAMAFNPALRGMDRGPDAGPAAG